MKDLTALALVLLPCLTATAGAIILAYNGRKGWGWFIIAAVILFPHIKID